MKYCPNCGAQLNDDEKICSHCGASLEDEDFNDWVDQNNYRTDDDWSSQQPAYEPRHANHKEVSQKTFDKFVIVLLVVLIVTAIVGVVFVYRTLNNSEQVVSDTDHQPHRRNKRKKTIVDVDDSKFIFPDSETKKLTDNQINKLSLDELRTAINEIYARHQYSFKNSRDQYEYFKENYSWYKGNVYDVKEVEKKFTKTEKSNVDNLAARRALLREQNEDNDD